MSLVGGLCFCTACNNLLERVSPTHLKIQCEVCGTTNPNNWPSTIVETSRPRSLPSQLRTKLQGNVQSVSEEELQKNGQKISQTCPECASPEMYFTALQLRSADEGTTVFYVCHECGHRYKEDN
ncbi:DNA-directed RNA polymerase I 13.7 kDa polypeptide [Sphaerulina musiva SO2202]|uniref:DNA-directed RNA polymerase subunit n=1 Tax=Sphaerulina musiva (strain SO2202) TaxID=692275 RepID=M3CBE6_SPHMS|nr:DNA-directed RNA polymerase I 13.7 kDa polypeptide [Sphaerulina musiva SO2202]EMF09752.1 DNA-directed RNA polymerase I 13.7 kDa polypeptide [Sphaerulina musiva SO2202]